MRPAGATRGRGVGSMFRRLFVLAALAGAAAWVAHRLGLTGRRDDDDPFEYAPPPMPEPPAAETPPPEAAPPSEDASTDDGEQQPAGE